MKKFLLFILVTLSTAYFGYGQVTTSTLTGTIKDSKEALIGATVKATHLPTGTVYGASTGADGRYTINNMQAGGPYKVEISYIGYQSQTFSDIILKLGEPYVLNLMLAATGTDLREVVVTATDPNSILNANRSGATTNISRAQIQSLPSISRSVNDITRLTPQANGTAIGGGSYRSNNFTVDGANFNNQFGIGQNIPANGSPISLDALDQISINVTPYDVRQTGFTGASINAVTRSGTNDLFATGFFLFRNERDQGNKVEDAVLTRQLYKQNQYGFSLGGPIVKNKLFFFVNGEFSRVTSPGQSRYASSAATPYPTAGNTQVSRPSETFLNSVSSYLKSKYNYDPGNYQGYNNYSQNDKFFARLDWNITPKHRFNIRYNQVESNSPGGLSTSLTNSGVSYTSNRGANTALFFQNSTYIQEANLYSGTAELNSRFGNKFSNVLRASISHQNDPRSSPGSAFPLVDILEAGSPITTFGYEPFTYGNLRDVKTTNYTDEFTAALGRHSLTLGAQAEFSTTKNGFQRFGTGYYVFASWADFVNNAKPTNYAVTYPLTADGSQAFPSFKFAQYSLYLQDDFSVTDKLKLSGGLRLERPTYPGVDEIRTHPLVAPLTFANGEKIDTGVLPEAKIMFSPRLGFNWDVKGDRSLQLRGGSGIFTGRIPYVWIVAQSGDAGLLQFLQTYSGTANTPFFNPSIAPNLTTPKGASGTAIPSSISAMDRDLKFPQTWKSSLAVDVKLPLGIVGTLEGIYNKDINAVYARNANLKGEAPLNTTGYPDNRPVYPTTNFAKQPVSLTSAGQVATTAAATSSSQFTAIVLDNTKGGHYWSVTAQLNKTLAKGISLTAAYTRNGAQNFGDLGGDQIANVWSYPVTSTLSNTPTLSYTSNVIPDRIIGALNVRKTFLKNLTSSASFFYEGSRASSSNYSRFSYIYSSDFNRDGATNDLIYVPKDPSEITFASLTVGSKTYTAQEQSDIFFNYIDQDDYLKTRKGQYAERNGAKYPWRNQVDFKFVQEVFKTMSDGKMKNSFQFTWDIFNLGNLLNKDWGVYKFTTAFSASGAQSNSIGILVPVSTTTYTAGGTTKPTFRMATANGDIVRSTFTTNQSITSTYYMQFGFRYTFQ